MVPSAATSAVSYLRGRGVSKEAAVAIVSVLYYESKLNPGTQGHQSTETPGVLNPFGAYGIASWNGPRQNHLQAFAAKHNLPVGDINTQLYFVLNEMANSYPQSWGLINSNKGYVDIIPTIVAEYENPADHQKEINGALTFAASLYDAVPEIAPPIAEHPPNPIQTGVTAVPPIPPEIISLLVQILVPVADQLFKTVLASHGIKLPGLPTAPAAPVTLDPQTLATEIIAAIQKQTGK